MMKSTLPLNALRAVELFAATKDVRFYLNGICVRTLDKDTLQLVATNGHILGEYRHTRDSTNDDPYTPGENYILPVGLTAGIKPTKHVPFVAVTASKEQWSVNYLGSARSGHPIDGTFPEYSRIWPTQLTLAPGNFDLRYLGLIQKACDLLEVRYPTLFQGGADTSSMFSIGQQFAGVIMPMRPAAEELPAWCATTLTSLTERLMTRLAEAKADDAPDADHAYQGSTYAVALALGINAQDFSTRVSAETAIIQATRAAAKQAVWDAAKQPEKTDRPKRAPRRKTVAAVA